MATATTLLMAGSSAAAPAEEGCKILNGKNVVAIVGLSPATKTGKLCIERRCTDLAVGQGLAVATVKAAPNAVITFTPRPAGIGCASVSERKNDNLQAMVTGAFTLLAGFFGLLGAFVLEAHRRTSDQRTIAAEWIETYRRKLAAWRREANADPTAPPLLVTDRRYRRNLQEIRRDIEALVDNLPTGADRRAREAACNEAAGKLETWSK